MEEQTSTIEPVPQTILSYYNEAKEAKRDRMDLNERNYNCYHSRGNYDHKSEGMSTEFLDKVSIATEQLTSSLQQGLVDFGKWYSIEAEGGVNKDEQQISTESQEKILTRQLDNNDFSAFIADSLKMGFLGSLMIAKVSGKTTNTITGLNVIQSASEGEEEKVEKTTKDLWSLNLNLVRQEDYFPDPTGNGLYEIERVELDRHQLIKTAEADPDNWDMAEVMALKSDADDDSQDHNKQVETSQNTPYVSVRKKITVYEFWGTLIDPMTAEIMVIGGVKCENCTVVISTQGRILRKPVTNEFWHGESPYVVAPIVRVPKSVWHKALMDGPTTHNYAMNELYNLLLDSGMMSVHGIKQLREDKLEDPSQVDDGIPPGTTLLANSNLGPNEKVLERVDTSDPNQDTLEVFRIMGNQFSESSLTTASTLGGVAERNVKATELVASTQSIKGIFDGIGKVVEEKYVQKILTKSWLVIAQHMNDMSLDVNKALLGKDVATKIAQMSKAAVFVDTAQGRKFKVFGLTSTLNKVNDFRKFTTLLQVLGASPQLMAEFQRKRSVSKFLDEVMTSLNIDFDKIAANEEEQAKGNVVADKLQEALANGEAGPGLDPNNVPTAGTGPAEGANPRAGNQLETGSGDRG